MIVKPFHFNLLIYSGPVQETGGWFAAVVRTSNCAAHWQPISNPRCPGDLLIVFRVRLDESKPAKATAYLPFWLAALPLGDDHLTSTFPVWRVPENVAGLPNKSN